MSEPINVLDEARFPVVHSVPLNPVKRRPFRRPARTADEIPGQRPGTVLIAQHNDAYELVQRGVRLTDSVLVEATSLLLVSIRRELVETVVVLPSADPYTGLQIRARYQCRVTDALLLLQYGGWDIEPILVEQLLGSARLRMECLRPFDATTWYRFQQRIIALLIAHGEINSPQLPGLLAQLTDAEITPTPLTRPTIESDELGLPGEPDWIEEPNGPLLRDGDPTFNADNYRWDETK